MNTVCLCGSTRFIEQYQQANGALSALGLSVITISLVVAKDDDGDDPLKEILDLVHLNKILRSDAIVVVGDGYIGRSTAREILWAYMQGKTILAVHDYTTHLSDGPHRTLIDWDGMVAVIRDPEYYSIINEQMQELVSAARKVLRL